MSEFEFYFGYYGLILGLSVAAVIGGLGRALNQRQAVRIGLLTPLLAIFLMVDIPSFWIYAWASRETVTISWNAMIGATAIGGAYYLAASMMFPVENAGWPDLDEHYWAKKRWIVGAMLAANLMMSVPGWVASPPDLTNPRILFSMAAFLAPTTALLFTRRRWIDVVLLVWLLAWYGFAALIS